MCLNCESRGLECTFSDAQKGPFAPPSPSEESDAATSNRTSTKKPEGPSRKPSSTYLTSLLDVDKAPNLPESKARRLLELRLMTNFIENLVRPFPDHIEAHVVTRYGSLTPQMGLEHNNVLYSMFAMSAVHLLRSAPDDPELAVAADVYLGLALNEQHNAVRKLSIENADSVCYTAVILLVNSFARLWTRELEPYSGPLELLRLGNGAVTVLRIAMEMLKQDPSSKFWLLINAPPMFDDNFLFAKENLKQFRHLLEGSGQQTDPEELEAYEKALCYVGYVHRSVNNDEPVYINARMIVCFAMFVPPVFVHLVGEKRPLALVIMAYFFAIAARYPSIWWVGKTPQREIQAIRETLPDEWQEQMHWPLMMAGLTMS